MIAKDLQDLILPIDELQTWIGNPHKGDKPAIKRSYETFGQERPLVYWHDVDGEMNNDPGANVVIDGNHQLMVARDELNWTEIAASEFVGTYEQALAYALAANRIAELGSNEDATMLELLDSFTDAELAKVTGYSDEDIATMLRTVEPEVLPTVAPPPSEVPKNPVTVPGDIWILGPHRIMCGDCRDAGSVLKLLNGSQINLAFTSPPYAQQRKYDEESGFNPIAPDEYVKWFYDVALNVQTNLAQDGSWFVNIKPASKDLDTELYVLDLVLAHVREWGWHFVTEFCWERVGVPKKVQFRFKNQFEPVFQFSLNRFKFNPEDVRHESSDVPRGTPVTNAASLQGTGAAILPKVQKYPAGTIGDRQGGAGDRPERLVGVDLAYPGNRLPTFSGSHSATGHPAAFPVGLPEFFVKAYTDRGDTVFDPFMGSGSTLMAAHIQGRMAFGMELSPGYVDVICRRFQELSGVTPINEATKESVDFRKSAE